VDVRAAVVPDLDELTAIAHAAKRSWGYSERWIASWKRELTFTEATLREQQVFVVEVAGAIAGVCGLRPAASQWELEHLWVLPERMGHGIGSLLLEHARSVALAAGASAIRIVSDPQAVRFYTRRGAYRIGDLASSIPGRRLPVLRLALDRG